MTPLADNYSWVLHVQGYQLLGRASQIVCHLAKGLCELGMQMFCRFFKNTGFGVTKGCVCDLPSHL